MPLELPRLPYDRTALQPHFSAPALDLHLARHRACVEAVNARIEGTELAELGLDEIVRQSQGSLFDMAAQAWNHAFYWQCLHPRGGGDPAGPLGELTGRHFGDGKRLREEFDRVALAVFGSGWVWLVQHPSGALAIQSTRNAGTPLTGQSTPLLGCNVWEHAYYTDYQNARGRYLDAFWKLVNWDFVAAQLRD
jgi:Fe-Mn family superoxide dismutase